MNPYVNHIGWLINMDVPKPNVMTADGHVIPYQSREAIILSCFDKIDRSGSSLPCASARYTNNLGM